MKRSEMITMLSGLLRNAELGGSYKKRAESILEFIEEAGMLPPPVGIGEEDQWGYLQYENEWEKE